MTLWHNYRQKCFERFFFITSQNFLVPRVLIAISGYDTGRPFSNLTLVFSWCKCREAQDFVQRWLNWFLYKLFERWQKLHTSTQILTHFIFISVHDCWLSFTSFPCCADVAGLSTSLAYLSWKCYLISWYTDDNIFVTNRKFRLLC